MKIAITGAMGVGKTTLANDLSEATGIDILPEVARIMAEEGVKLDKGITIETERKIFERQMLLEDETKGNIIADRCLVDALAYTMELFWNELDLIEKIRTELNKNRYDVIFYIAPEFPIEEDGLRSTDIKFQKKIDSKIRRILKLGNLNWHKLNGTREERVDQVFKHLTSIK